MKTADLLIKYNLSWYLKQLGTEFRLKKSIHCPFADHSDSSPSFSVYTPDKFKCFGCGRQGNVIDFILHYHGLFDRDAALQYYRRETGAAVSVLYVEQHADAANTQATRPAGSASCSTGVVTQVGNLLGGGVGNPVTRTCVSAGSASCSAGVVTQVGNLLGGGVGNPVTRDCVSAGSASCSTEPLTQSTPHSRTTRFILLNPTAQDKLCSTSLHHPIYRTFYDLLSVDDQLTAYLTDARRLPYSFISTYGLRNLTQPAKLLSLLLEKFSESDLLSSGIIKNTASGNLSLFASQAGVIFPHFCRQTKHVLQDLSCKTAFQQDRHPTLRGGSIAVTPDGCTGKEYAFQQDRHPTLRAEIAYLSFRSYQDKRFMKLSGVPAQLWFFPSVASQTSKIATRRLCIFESIIDAISYTLLHAEVDLLALCGCSVSEPDLLRICLRYDSVSLCLDNDPAGKTATAKYQKIIRKSLYRLPVTDTSSMLVTHQVKDWNEYVCRKLG